MKDFSILLVDDEIEILENLKYDILNDLGRSILYSLNEKVEIILDTSTSCFDALRRAKISHYNCIVVDINIPNMNGIELVNNMKVVGSFDSVIFLTGYEDLLKFDQKIKSVEALDVVHKPYVKDDLIYLLFEAYCESSKYVEQGKKIA